MDEHLTIAGWTREDLLEAALLAPRRSFVPLADTEVIDRDDWFQLTTPSLRDGGLNEVGLAVVDPEDVDRTIDATRAHFQRLGIRYRWTVGPDSRPHDLAARLVAKGMVERSIRVMVCALGDAPWPPAEGIRVVRVGLAEVPIYADVMAEGWDMRPGPIRDMYRDLVTHHGDRFAMFLGYDGDRAVGASGSVLLPRAMFFQGAVVLPPYRKRGMYRALIAARVALARARGLRLLVIHARAETSAPIVERLGFQTLLTYPSLSEP